MLGIDMAQLHETSSAHLEVILSLLHSSKWESQAPTANNPTLRKLTIAGGGEGKHIHASKMILQEYIDCMWCMP